MRDKNENIKMKESFGHIKIDFRESMNDFEPKFHTMYRFAKDHHDWTGGIRKASGAPYIVHPDTVAKVVIAYSGTDDQIDAALAHDLIEDADVDYNDLEEQFGKKVADIVQELTNDNDKIAAMGKEDYMTDKLCHLSHDALLIKLADIYCNSADKPAPETALRMVNNLLGMLNKRHDLTDNEEELANAALEEYARATAA